MKPDFEQYASQKGEPTEVTSIRVPSRVRELIDACAEAECVSRSDLILEGIARVIEDRKSDPNFGEAFSARLERLRSIMEQAK